MGPRVVLTGLEKVGFPLGSVFSGVGPRETFNGRVGSTQGSSVGLSKNLAVENRVRSTGER